MTCRLSPPRPPRSDDAHPGGSFRDTDDQQAWPPRVPDDDLTALIERVVRIVPAINPGVAAGLYSSPDTSRLVSGQKNIE